MEELIKIFESVRDIPYRIPLSLEEEDNCCSGKHEKLLRILKERGYEVRYRVCVFLWSSLSLPKDLKKISHSGKSSHIYLEIKLDGVWRILDATWDKGLKGLFHVSEWDGKSNTEIAVKPVKIFSAEETTKVVKMENDEISIKRDLEANGKFYEAFNKWLEKNRC